MVGLARVGEWEGGGGRERARAREIGRWSSLRGGEERVSRYKRLPTPRGRQRRRPWPVRAAKPRVATAKRAVAWARRVVVAQVTVVGELSGVLAVRLWAQPISLSRRIVHRTRHNGSVHAQPS